MPTIVGMFELGFDALVADCDRVMMPELEATMIVLHKLTDESRRELLKRLIRQAYCKGAANAAIVIEEVKEFVQILDTMLEEETPRELH